MRFTVLDFDRVGEAFSALAALRNRGAFLTLVSTSLICLVVFALGGMLTVKLGSSGHSNFATALGLLGIVLLWLMVTVGLSAAGFQINAQMQDREQPGKKDALLSAIVTLPRLICLQLIPVLALALIALAIWICALPAVGPVIFTVVYPVAIVCSGILILSSAYVLSMAGPAVWNGNNVLQSLAIFIAIARQRLFELVSYMVGVVAVTAFVSGMVFLVILLGWLLTTALSAGILGASVDFSRVSSSAGQMLGGGSVGYVQTGGLGFLALFLCAAALPLMVSLGGRCIAFNSLVAEVDTGAVQEKLTVMHAKARSSLDEAREQLAVQKAALSASAASFAQSATASSGTGCPQCSQPIAASDKFCGSCGHKLM